MKSFHNAVDTRKLVNVSAGEISATSTDAVNGSQLYELDQKINAGASSPYLSVNATNDIADPLTSAKARGAHSIAIGENAIAAEKNSVAIGMNAYVEADSQASSNFYSTSNAIALGANSVVHNTDLISALDKFPVLSIGDSSTNLKRRIINVADGVLDSDAATLGQVERYMRPTGVTLTLGSSSKALFNFAPGTLLHKPNFCANDCSGTFEELPLMIMRQKFENP